MDLVNTVKVSHIRAAAAYRKALDELDAALPAMQLVAAAKDAAVRAAYDKEVAEWRERTSAAEENRRAWREYDKALAEWSSQGLFRSRAAEPSAPAFPRPDRWPYVPSIPPMLGVDLRMHREKLKLLRSGLKGKLAMASVALCPFRVDAATAVTIVECEDGTYVANLKAAFERQIELSPW